jgi:hypothetical protein
MTNALTESLRPHARKILTGGLSHIPENVFAVPFEHGQPIDTKATLQALTVLMPVAALQHFGEAYFAQDVAVLVDDLKPKAEMQLGVILERLGFDISVDPNDAPNVARARFRQNFANKIDDSEILLIAKSVANDPSLLLTFAGLNASLASYVGHMRTALREEAVALGTAVPDKVERLGARLESIMQRGAVKNMARGPLSFAALIQERDLREGKRAEGTGLTEGNFFEVANFLNKRGFFAFHAAGQETFCVFTRWFDAAAGSVTGNDDTRTINKDGARLWQTYTRLRGSNDPKLLQLGASIRQVLAERLEEFRGNCDAEDQAMPRWLEGYSAPTRNASQPQAASAAKQLIV